MRAGSSSTSPRTPPRVRVCARDPPAGGPRNPRPAVSHGTNAERDGRTREATGRRQFAEDVEESTKRRVQPSGVETGRVPTKHLVAAETRRATRGGERQWRRATEMTSRDGGASGGPSFVERRELARVDVQLVVQLVVQLDGFGDGFGDGRRREALPSETAETAVRPRIRISDSGFSDAPPRIVPRRRTRCVAFAPRRRTSRRGRRVVHRDRPPTRRIQTPVA